MRSLIFLSLLIFCYSANAQYNGTASVTHGLATAIQNNLYTCVGGRITNIGSITASDSSVWIVPSAVNFTNTSFPFSSDLHNACAGLNYANDDAALATLNGSDIVIIDSTGELITAYIFADNYFELYINGVQVGKDKVPYTQFNSSIVRFKVNRPFTVAMLLVDWEENLGLGSENNQGFSYYVGDGGMVAVFKDSNNNIIAKTDSNWKAQTFYTSPVTDLTCPTEVGNLRLSNLCTTASTNNGSTYYGLHWNRPSNWMDEGFNDSSFPQATTFTNTVVGVNNKPAYTNFTNIFDSPENDAEFIWSTNLLLDNEVLVRYTVPLSTNLEQTATAKTDFKIFQNLINNCIEINFDRYENLNDIQRVSIFNFHGQTIFKHSGIVESIPLNNLAKGIYFVEITDKQNSIRKKIIIK